MTCVAVVDGGKFIVAGGRDGSISLWKFDPKSMKFDKDFFRRTLGKKKMTPCQSATRLRFQV